jgi:TolB-like protein/Flp pilus assembly protein TadD
VAENLFDELKRRKVIKVGAAYLVVAWLAVQGASIGFPAFDAPPWALRIFILVMLLGFPVALVMAWVFESTPEGVKFDPVRSGTRRVVAVAVALGALAMAWYFYGQASVHPGEHVVADSASPAHAASAALATAAPATAPAPDPKSIAVLAFTDLSPGHDQEYFSDGVSEEILNALVQVSDLKVAGRTSSFFYKGRNVDLRQIGKALGVAHVLEGSVRKQGDRVRITAQLIRTADGIHLWSKNFDGELTDVFKLQDQVARAIVDELQPMLEGSQKDKLVATATSNPEAYQLYLRASEVINKRDYAHGPDAVAWLEQALKLDPKFVRAEAHLALVQMLVNTHAPDHAEQARKHALAAQAADPTLAEPVYVLGLTYRYERKFLEARPYLDRAVQMAPRDASTHMYLAQWLIITGYTHEGIAELDRALAIDPMLPNAANWRGYQYLYAGDFDDAQALFERTRSLGLTLATGGLGEVALWHGDVANARKLMAEAAGNNLRICGDASPATMGELLAGTVHGDAAAQARSRAIIDACVATNPADLPSWTVLSLMRLAEWQRALDLFANRRSTDDAGVAFRLWSPFSTPMRLLPGFPAAAQKIGWVDAWEKYGPPDLCTRTAPRVYACR